MKKIIAIIVASLLATLGLSAPAQADDRPNYTVTETGIQLPSGYAFEDGGHVNIKWVDEDGEHSAGMHFEKLNNQPGGYFIGKSFFPFSSLIKNFDKCPQVVWVQVHGWNYHYTATPDPDKCAAPPADEDDDSNNEADSDNEGDKNTEGDKSSEGDKASEGDNSSEGDKTSEGDKASEGDKTDDGSKDGGDHDSKDIDDSNTDSQKDADGGKDGGDIPPTGISGMVLSLMLGGGLIIVGALTIANSRSKKSARH